MREPGMAVACGAFTIFGVGALHAAERMNGRWAADPSACAGPGPAPAVLVVTNDALRWSGDSCRIGRVYRTGDTVYLEARCSGEAGNHSVPVTLHMRGDRMHMRWGHGAIADLRRCP
jgi:hypothetical protein